MRASYIIETYYYIDRAGGLSVSAPVLHPILRIFNACTPSPRLTLVFQSGSQNVRCTAGTDRERPPQGRRRRNAGDDDTRENDARGHNICDNRRV